MIEIQNTNSENFEHISINFSSKFKHPVLPYRFQRRVVVAKLDLASVAP